MQLIRKSRPGVFEALETDVEGPSPTPEHVRADEELGRDLAEAMSNLSEIERVCFVLKHLEQWRAREISAELGLNVGQIKQAVFRAVKKLRGYMQELQRNYDE